MLLTVCCYSSTEPEGEAGAEAATLLTAAVTMIFRRETGMRSGTLSTRPRARSITWYVLGDYRRGQRAFGNLRADAEALVGLSKAD